MKNTIVTFIIASTFLAGTFLTGCQSSAEKVDDAQSKVVDAKQDLKEVQRKAAEDAQKAANAEEWRIFKAESEVKIKANETRIAELKDKMRTSGKTLGALYAENINALEQKNKAMQVRMDAYDKGQSDWASFKREFNHDMDELGQALKDFTVNNKK